MVPLAACGRRRPCSAVPDQFDGSAGMLKAAGSNAGTRRRGPDGAQAGACRADGRGRPGVKCPALQADAREVDAPAPEPALSGALLDLQRHREAGDSGTVDEASREGAAAATPRRSRSRRRRRVLWLLLPLAALLLVVAVAVTALQARSAARHLQAARGDLRVLADAAHSGDTAGLAAATADLRGQAHAAHRDTSGPLWGVAGHLPGVRSDARLARGLTAVLDDLASGPVGTLATSASTLRPSVLLAHGQVDLPAVQALAPQVQAAGPLLAAALARAQALPATAHVGALAGARTQLIAQLAKAQGSLTGAQQAVSLAPPLLGADGPRRYFLAFVNPAESRSGGGLVGTYGVLVADHGRITLEHTGSDLELRDAGTGDHGVPVTLPADFAGTQWYAEDLPGAWYRTNLSPDFPTTATIWATKYAAQMHTTIDGAISLDPVALGYLLGSRTVRLSDGTTVTGRTIAADTLSTFYARYADPDVRKARLVELAGAAFTELTRSLGTGSLAQLQRSAAEGRLQVWSAHPGEQTQLAGLALGGRLPDTPGPFAWVGLDNLAGTKADYWLDRHVVYAGQCPAPGADGDGTRETTLTVTLTNTEPPGQPAYVATRYDTGHVGVADGSSSTVTTVYAAVGADLESATLDGAAVDVEVASEHGHPTYTLPVELPRGRSTTLVLHLLEPLTGTPVSWRPQPMARPQTGSTSVTPCGLKLP